MTEAQVTELPKFRKCSTYCYAITRLSKELLMTKHLSTSITGKSKFKHWIFISAIINVFRHSCLICDFWCKTYSFKFDAGFSTYHGLSRNKSGVAEWAVYLANHFAPSKKDAVTFEK